MCFLWCMYVYVRHTTHIKKMIFGGVYTWYYEPGTMYQVRSTRYLVYQTRYNIRHLLPTLPTYYVGSLRMYDVYDIYTYDAHCCCTWYVFTSNRSCYPTSAVPPVSFLILHPRLSDTNSVVTVRQRKTKGR